MRSWLIVLATLVLAAAVPLAAPAQNLPAPPAVLLDTTYAAPVGGMIYGHSAALAQGAQGQAGGVGIACQGRQLRPAAVRALFAQKVRDGTRDGLPIDLGPAQAQ